MKKTSSELFNPKASDQSRAYWDAYRREERESDIDDWREIARLFLILVGVASVGIFLWVSINKLQ